MRTSPFPPVALGMLLAACTQAIPPAPPAQTGEASVYSDRFEGRKTASGERFSQGKPTAAHPALPLGSTVAVTNLETGRTTDVVVNDRGPHVAGRIIDLSEQAATAIGLEDGTAPVKVEPR